MENGTGLWAQLGIERKSGQSSGLIEYVNNGHFRPLYGFLSSIYQCFFPIYLHPYP